MKCIVAVCMSAAVAMAVADAFRIESTAVAPPSDILGEHQELQKTWTVYSEDSLEKLHISVPGPVFIALESSETTATETPAPSTETPAPSTEAPETDTPSPSTGEDDGDAYSTSSSSSSSGSGSGSNSNDTIQFPVMKLSHKHAKESKVATIVVSGNSSALLELLEVVALKKDDTNGVRLHLQNKDGQADGFVLTQITLTEANVVRHLSAALATSVDVASGVVVAKDSDNKIKIASAGTTKVFIAEDSDVHVNDLVVDVAGSGSVQWIVNGSVKVNGDLSTSVAGNGAIALHATSLEAEKLKTTLSGSGATYVVAKTLDVDSLETSVYGSAFASFNVENGTAKDHALTVSGSGVVYAGSIVAKKTDADIWGSGVAYVSVTDKLKASTSYSGHVYYVGARPDEVKTSGWFFWRSSVTPADANKIVEHAAVDSPAAYPEYIALVTKEARHSDEPIVTVDDGESVAFMVMTSHMAAVVHGPNGFLVVSVIGVGIVALAMVVQSYQHHRVRRHYTPLV